MLVMVVVVVIVVVVYDSARKYLLISDFESIAKVTRKPIQQLAILVTAKLAACVYQPY